MILSRFVKMNRIYFRATTSNSRCRFKRRDRTSHVASQVHSMHCQTGYSIRLSAHRIEAEVVLLGLSAGAS
jgi:hypothetical protein